MGIMSCVVENIDTHRRFAIAGIVRGLLGENSELFLKTLDTPILVASMTPMCLEASWVGI